MNSDLLRTSELQQSAKSRELHSSTVGAEPIAIIGIGCRLPGNILSPDDYWRALCNGFDAIEEVPSSRWDQFKFYDKDPGRQGKIITKWGGFVKDIDQFDPTFFGISPREAASMDPQQRLVLESAFEALEDAGQRAEALAGTKVGVFVGVSTFDYGLMQNTFSDVSGAGPYTNTGQALSICANRLSFVMNWKGPSFIVDTACSSSLLACHLAMNSIRRGESSMAVVSGVNFICAPSTYVGFTAMGMLSPDGHCKAFDDSANGFVRAEGGCSVVLKPLHKAIADGDRIYALMAGSACNQDGHTPGLTMPSQSSQEMLVREACRQAGIDPIQVRYVEAHGTGTPVGDPIEVNALGSVLGQRREAEEPCLVGSVKANIGHLEAGSGIAGLIKAALVLKHRQVPPNIHFNHPNPNIDFEGLRLKVPTELTPLPHGDGPAYAGINSFGFGGTNVHLILSEHVNHADVGTPCSDTATTQVSLPVDKIADGSAAPTQKAILFPLSARSPESLRRMAASYADSLDAGGEWSNAKWEDILFTVSERRSHHPLRASVVAHHKEELVQRLREIADDENDSWMTEDKTGNGTSRPVAFVFSGQGPQWWAMGRELYECEPVFRAVLDRCEAIIRTLVPWSLIEELHRSEDTSRIHETAYAQPAIFAIQVGLYELWKSWGIKPAIVVGHSVGEVAAAYAAGILTFEDATKVITHRGRTMGVVQEAGAMLAVAIPLAQVPKYLEPWGGRICLAAVNGPTTVTLSGDAELINQMELDFQAQNIFARRLQVNYAFHSHQMDPVQTDLVASLGDILPGPAQIPMISTVTGAIVNGSDLGADYWWRNVREPVLFLDAMKQLAEREYSLVLEISPHPVLAGAIGESYTGLGKQCNVVTSLRRGEPERIQMLKSLGGLYALQCSIQWSALSPQGEFIRFPKYPWNKQSYWSESEDSKVSRLPCVGHPILGARLPGSRLVYQGFMDTRAQPFALDHKIQGHVLMPGTGFLEIGMALGKEIYGENNFVITDIELLKAAFMPEKETLMTNTIFDIRTGRYLIESQPLGQPDRPWTLHCVGVLRERAPVAPSEKPNLPDVKQRCTQSIPSNVFYDFFRRCGFPFGPAFRGLTQIRLGVGEMLGVVDVPSECEADFEQYLFHPAVLDACLQGNFGCFMTYNRPGNNIGDLDERIRKAEIFMPSGYDEVRLYKKPSKKMWTYVRMHERYKDQSSSDIFIYDDEGDLIAEIRGFKETLIGTVEGNADSASGMLYEYEWKLQPASNLQPKHHRLPELAKHCLPAELSVESLVQEKCSGLEREREFIERLQPICAELILASLERSGLDVESSQTFGLTELCDKIECAPATRPLVGQLLAVLKNHGLVREANGELSFQRKSVDANGLSALRDLFWSYPEFYAQGMLLSRCVQHLPQILRGDVDPKDVVGPGAEVQELLFASSPSKELGYLATAKYVASLFQSLLPGRVGRILDVRGASGRFATIQLSELPNQLVDYIFGDKDDKEFGRIGESLADYSRLKFHVLDLENPGLPSDPSTEEQSPLPQVEVIVAHDALMANPDRIGGLNFLYDQLAPGGVLLLSEVFQPKTHELLTLGLVANSIASKSTSQGETEVTCIDDWVNTLQSVGFEFVRSLWSETGFESWVDPVIVAQKPVAPLVDETQVPAMESAPSALSVEDEAERDSQQAVEPSSETWLVFADSDGVADRISQKARVSGKKVICVEVGEAYECIDENRFSMQPTLENFHKLLTTMVDSRPTKVLYLWGQNGMACESGLESLTDAQKYCVWTPVMFCQAWTQVFAGGNTNLWLISRNSQSVGGTASRLEVGQTPLWGTGRVVTHEFPHLSCKLLDLGVADDAEIDSLLAEMESGSKEDEVALRSEARYVHRLVGSSLTRHADKGEEPGKPYRLHLSDYGTLDGMRLRPAVLRDPLDLPTLVEIEVHAAALNFSDVMKALALYPGLPEGFVPVGIECAGVITKVGAEVTGFQVGDEVVCITPMAISSHTYTDQRFVAHKPKHLSMAAAATLPIAFLTAQYALNYVGRMEEKEKVLINAATGGVGLAAIQLAQQMEAELFATAGTTDKRELLSFLGLPHVMNSRTLAFADEIMEITKNRGVDLILNSLANEAITKGVSILADYGRFLEIGKRDIYANTPLGLRAFRKNISFAAIDLDRGLREKPDLCSKMFRQIIADADSGKIAPLPHRIFPVTHLVDAFRYMAKAKHIGKVIVEMKNHPVRPARDPAETTYSLKPDASYLITGGLGGLGAPLAQWMVEHGAKCLILASRRGVHSDEAKQIVRDLEERGVQIVDMRVDISQADQVRAMIEKIEQELPPLKGVMHAAVVLDDGLILQLTEERIAKVCAPKLDGAWHLHEATKQLSLDFFVCHSSTSSTMGNAGQANYSAANAFLDGLAEYRRSMGLPALTVNWGYLGDLGVAAGNKKLADRFEQQGVRAVPPSEGLPILGKLMAFDINQMAVMRVDWNRLRQLAVTMAQSPRFSQMMLSTASDEAGSKSGNDIRNLILATDPSERFDAMLSIVREKVARVLGTKLDKIEVDRSLMDMGLDSLMGFELRNWIEGELRINVPVVELMQGPTVQKLTSLILAQLEKGDDPSSTAGGSSVDPLAGHLALLNSDPKKASAVTGLLSMADEIKSDLQGASESVDLQQELDHYVDLFEKQTSQLDFARPQYPDSIRKVMLTGATGFLGAYLVHHLLETNGNLELICLVRAESTEAGHDRLRANLQRYGLWNDSYDLRLRAVLGDVSSGLLGMDEATYEELSRDVDLVLHNAAGVNFIKSYSQLKQINVEGTLHAIQFAVHGRVKAYHHVSTLFVFSILDHLELTTVSETHKPSRHEFLYLGYLQSKWVADSLAQVARERGLPVTIYRPSIVTGDSQTGVCADDVISRTLASAVQMGCSPSANMRFTFTPVDFVGKAIATLLMKPASVNQSYHLVNPDVVDWSTVVQWLGELGHRVDAVPYDDWLEQLKRRSTEDDATTMLSSMLPLMPDVYLGGQYDVHLDPPSFDNRLTLQALSFDDIDCPTVTKDLIATYVGQMMKSGAISSNLSENEEVMLSSETSRS